MPLKSNKQYGDQGAIDSLVRQASGMKQGADAAAPTIRTPVGRPRGTGSQVAAPAGQPAQGPVTNIPDEHRSIMDRAAKLAAFAGEASQYADDPLYGGFLNEYAARMRASAEDALREVKTGLPDFDVE